MKKILLTIMLGIVAICTLSAADAIVIYFSATGNTERIANMVADALDADTHELVPQIPYTEADLRYYTDCRADREQRDANARVAIAGELPDLSDYDTILLGYPIWHGQAPKILYTFVESVDLEGKRIVPFCTSGSSGVGSSVTRLSALSDDDAIWEAGRRFSSRASRNEINSWLAGLGLR